MDKSSFSERITIEFLKEVSVGRALMTILAVSSAALLFLLWILYIKPPSAEPGAWVYSLPSLNAFLNSVSTVLILAGYAAIVRSKYRLHMRCMLSAFVASALFLVSYLVYHNSVGHTPFTGQGWIRPVYFTILITHVILSASVVPLVLTSYYMAFSGRLSLHKKVSKWTFPIWLYVSVTGVVIYLILRGWN